MAEILVALVVVALLVERVMTGRDWTRERSRLLNRIEARSAHELLLLNKAEDAPAPPKDPQAAHEIIHGIGV